MMPWCSTQVGLQVNQTSEQVGTAALAYAIHKAASPIRFPPTVALTPARGPLTPRRRVIARALGAGLSPSLRAATRATATAASQVVAKWLGKEDAGSSSS